MHAADFIQIALYLAALIALTPLLGKFMALVFQGERTFLSPILAPVERLIYKFSGIDAKNEMTWLHYLGALLAFNLAGCLLTLVQMMTQAWLPLNPQHRRMCRSISAKKIEAPEIRRAIIGVLAPCALILVGSAIGVAAKASLARLNNNGPTVEHFLMQSGRAF